MGTAGVCIGGRLRLGQGGLAALGGPGLECEGTRGRGDEGEEGLRCGGSGQRGGARGCWDRLSVGQAWGRPEGLLSVSSLACSAHGAGWMPRGCRTLAQAARTLRGATGLFSPHAQVSLPRTHLRCVGLPRASPSPWHQLLLRAVSLQSAGRNRSGGAGICHFSRLLNIWLRRACTAAEDMAEQRYCVDYAKRGTAGCKKCKEKIVKGMVRIGKIVPNPFTESGGDMKEWYHVKCIFEKLEKARATTKKIEDITDLEGWEELQDGEKELINKHISGKT